MRKEQMSIVNYLISYRKNKCSKACLCLTLTVSLIGLSLCQVGCTGNLRMQVQFDPDTGQYCIVEGAKPVLQYNYATVEPPAGYVEKLPENAHAYFYLGELCFKKLNRIEESIQHYSKCLALDGKFMNLYLNLGRAYLSVGEYRQAHYCFKKELVFFPERPQKEDVLGEIFNVSAIIENQDKDR